MHAAQCSFFFCSGAVSLSSTNTHTVFQLNLVQDIWTRLLMKHHHIMCTMHWAKILHKYNPPHIAHNIPQMGNVNLAPYDGYTQAPSIIAILLLWQYAYGGHYYKAIGAPKKQNNCITCLLLPRSLYVVELVGEAKLCEHESDTHSLIRFKELKNFAGVYFWWMAGCRNHEFTTVLPIHKWLSVTTTIMDCFSG